MLTLVLGVTVSVAVIFSTLALRVSALKGILLPVGAGQLLMLGVAVLVAGLAPNALEGVGAMLLAVGLIAWSTLAGSHVVRSVFFLARRDGLEQTASLPGSSWIGSVERATITMSLCLGLTEFAAVVLGVKALGQYQMSDNHGAAGRVLGTLSSALWALCCYAVFFAARFER